MTIKTGQERRYNLIMAKIIIKVADIELHALLYDTPTAQGIKQILPIESIVSTWGEEIYFDIPLKNDLEADARQDVRIGDLGYWPEGPAFCIFFGPTPVSTSGNPRAYSPVNVFGKILEDPAVLKTVRNNTLIRVDLYPG
jgi:uncharacterized protein